MVMLEKKSKWPIYSDFSHLNTIILPFQRDNLKSFSCILLTLVIHVTNDQFSDNFNAEWKKNKMAVYCDFRILRQ